nr:hypothetical protein [Tanacetum cinerariifolium]
MFLLLVQGKLTNLTVEERFAFNVSLRMFTRSVVIQRRMEDLQLGVESYQKKLNLIKPDMYRTDLKHKEAYTTYSNLRGFIYQNKDKQNMLMRIDELHKFSDDMLNDVRTALDDRICLRLSREEGYPLVSVEVLRSTTRTQSRQMSASESAFTEEPVQTTCQMDEPLHPVFETEEVYKATTDQLDWVNPEGQQYPHNLLQPLPLIPDNRGRRVILFAHFINNDLEYLQGGASSQKYTTSVTKTKGGRLRAHQGQKRQQFYGFAINRESALDVYSKRRIIAVTDLKIVKWHNYKHLDWISIRRDDDKIYKFKEGNFKRLRLQDIEDMMLLLKRLNLTKPDTYRSDLKRREAYTAYSNPQRFIYQNKDKKNRLMQIDELHKFSDGTLNDVRNALDDRLNGIRMQYLPQAIWRKGDKDRAAAMIQSIDKMLKTRRIIRSLERFVGGRLYEGDFRMLQRTI